MCVEMGVDPDVLGREWMSGVKDLAFVHALNDRLNDMMFYLMGELHVISSTTWGCSPVTSPSLAPVA